MKTCFIICLVAFLSSCSPKQQATVINPEEYLSKLQTLELDVRKHESYQKYHDTVLGQMTVWLNQIETPEQLLSVFWKCHSAWQAKPETPQDQLQWINPHAESLNLIMYSLCKRQTTEAAKILVNLYCDPKAGWDAGASLMAGDAVVKGGKLALPYLKLKKDADRDVSRLIELIESEATTGL